MNRKSILLVAVLIHLTSSLFSQSYPSVTVDPWTTKNNEKSTYYKMVEWDSSPYEEFTYLKRSGPNSWEVTEYLNFRLLSPNGYNTSDSDEKYPILIMLHGAGESGVKWSEHFDYVNGYNGTPPEPEKVDNNDHQLLYGGKEFLQARNKAPSFVTSFPGFVLFPQVQYNAAWAGEFDEEISKNNRQLIELVEILLVDYNIDPNRIYLLGLSNGARGVWDLINRRPDLFAAAVPLSGVGDATLMADQLAHFPTWLFQGGLDDNPAPSAAMQMVTALENSGGTPRFTLYENKGHNVWDTAFTEPDFFPWLKSKSKLSVHVYFGKTHFSKDEAINVKLGISPGFSDYQWQKNGSIIAQSNSPNLVVNSPGSYQVRFSRSGEWTEWSEPVVITNEDTLPALPVVYRINTGGSAVSDAEVDWDEDSDSNPSQYLSSASSISSMTVNNPGLTNGNTTDAPDIVFESWRTDTTQEPLNYSFPAHGEAIISLFFVKNEADKNPKTFNINIEGENIIRSFDIYAQSESQTIMRSFLVNVVDSSLDISLQGVIGQPVLSGIEIKGMFERQEIPTAVGEDRTSSVVVFPNPFTNVINIKTQGNHQVIENFAIYNILGKLCYQNTAKKASDQWLTLDNLDSYLASGAYFIELQFKNKTKRTFKVIKL